MSRAIAWCLLAIWSAWLFALQGLFAAEHPLTAWTPDVGVCLLLSLDPRFGRREALLAVGIVSAARAAFSADPPLAILVGYAALMLAQRLVRRGIEVDRPISRGLLAGVFGAALHAYWGLARVVALAASGHAVAQPAYEPGALWRVAAGTALAAAFLGPLLVRLPGMSPLRRSRLRGREAFA